ncbi:MAG: hypothetical protein KBC94_23195 [Pseudacidovorax sp.]|uniref:hypothetical protein n=1 Tax=Pseudacidovorax sp. TaxID=1934311 RepID=UPI001B643875|nr:hypothetical protein [Pseudacidovorax sp.]MBP6897333.1 hypothetical protein [Pseudacidovorax sp.]
MDYAFPPELNTVIAAAQAARNDCAKVAAKINEAAAQLPALEADLQRLAGEIGAEEGKLALADAPAEIKRHEKVIKDLLAESETKEREVKRLRARIQALEEQAPALDEALRAAVSDLRIEFSGWQNGLAARIGTELEALVAPIRTLVAVAKAAAPGTGATSLSDFVAAAYIPDPDGFVRIPTATGWESRGRNLLEGLPTSQPAEAEAVAAQCLPVLQALRAGESHTAYVPLARRPVPYVRKGYEIRSWTSKSDSDSDAPGTAASPAARVEPQELNVAPAMTAAALGT